VDVSSGTLGDLTATAPVLIAEITSPSSATFDLGDKSAEYLRLASLAAYLVLAQDEPKAWVWIRGEAGFSPGPAVLDGRETMISIAPLAIELPLAEIYPVDIRG
jgi:Uma2 family endonuclease